MQVYTLSTSLTRRVLAGTSVNTRDFGNNNHRNPHIMFTADPPTVASIYILSIYFLIDYLKFDSTEEKEEGALSACLYFSN